MFPTQRTRKGRRRLNVINSLKRKAGAGKLIEPTAFKLPCSAAS